MRMGGITWAGGKFGNGRTSRRMRALEGRGLAGRDEMLARLGWAERAAAAVNLL